MADFTDTQIGEALKALGNYRVRRAQVVALEGEPDGISGSLLLSLGLRETRLRNIEGGAKLVDGRWVAEDDPARMDVGIFQISRRYHMADLRRMVAVASGTWKPTVDLRTAADGGFCPRFEESIRYVLSEMHEAIAYGEDRGVKGSELPRFAVAAHNAGIGGAIEGYRQGDMDARTTGGDYSGWTLRHRTKINSWLGAHANWRAG
ncbi:MAG: hypothetical protein WKF96_08085 [Solirubrobacteraceae bacterium]